MMTRARLSSESPGQPATYSASSGHLRMPGLGVCPKADPLMLPMACGGHACSAQEAEVRGQHPARFYGLKVGVGSPQKGCISGGTQSEEQPFQARAGLAGWPGGFQAADIGPGPSGQLRCQSWESPAVCLARSCQVGLKTNYFYLI